MIAAINQQRILGVNNVIPWLYKGDLKYFKEQTQNNVVIMGRRTWESLPGKVRPLPKRRNVVLSSRQLPVPSSVIVANSMSAAFAAIGVGRTNTSQDIWLMGGSRIYKQGFNVASELHLTIVPWEEKVDVLDRVARFPNIPGDWYVAERNWHPYDADLELAILKRRIVVD